MPSASFYTAVVALGFYKNSAVALTIGLMELTARARAMQEFSFQVFEAFTAATRYPNFQVLKHCSTEVAKGEVVGVCGPSGSGKSTLIKCVNGLEPFQEGTITVAGISVSDRKTDLPKLRACIGMVFQHFELFPHVL
jgi:ABC-type sugar transport system ATPase subunit